MKILSLFIALFFCHFSNAQFYYTDLVQTKETNKQYKLMAEQKIKKLSVTKNNEANEMVTDFLIEKLFSKNNTVTTRTHTEFGKYTETVNYYTNYQITKIQQDGIVEQTVEYFYDAKHNLVSVQSSSSDTANKYYVWEEHKYLYRNDKPIQMLKIKNDTDTTIVNFKQDEQGNTIEESWMRKGVVYENYYYYYNDKNELTDIVKYNRKSGKMLPEFIFEYNSNGTIAETKQIPFGGSNYTIFKYNYLPNLLKSSEACYNKQNEFLGKLIYNYQQ